MAPRFPRLRRVVVKTTNWVRRKVRRPRFTATPPTQATKPIPAFRGRPRSHLRRLGRAGALATIGLAAGMKVAESTGSEVRRQIAISYGNEWKQADTDERRYLAMGDIERALEASKRAKEILTRQMNSLHGAKTIEHIVIPLLGVGGIIAGVTVARRSERLKGPRKRKKFSKAADPRIKDLELSREDDAVSELKIDNNQFSRLLKKFEKAGPKGRAKLMREEIEPFIREFGPFYPELRRRLERYDYFYIGRVLDQYPESGRKKSVLAVVFSNNPKELLFEERT